MCFDRNKQGKVIMVLMGAALDGVVRKGLSKELTVS